MRRAMFWVAGVGFWAGPVLAHPALQSQGHPGHVIVLFAPLVMLLLTMILLTKVRT